MTQILIVRILLIGCGGLLLVAWAFLVTGTVRSLMQWTKVTGHVKELKSLRRKKITLYRPVIEFTLPSGEVVEFTSRSAHSVGAYDVGQPVQVRYNPLAPQDAHLQSFSNWWLGPLALIVFGGLLVWAGVGITAEQLPISEPPVSAEDDPYKYYLLFWIGPALFFLFGFFGLAGGLWHLAKMISTLFWPAVKGVVVQSGVRASDGFFSPDITYSFEVDGRKYESSAVDIGRAESGDEAGPQQIVRRYGEGKEVVAHYNPKKPGESVLIPGFNVPLLLMFFGAGLGFMFVAWIFWAGSREGWLQ